MTHEMGHKTNTDQSEDELQHREENDYRQYICKEIYHNEQCGFTIRGQNEDEIVEHAHMHQEIAHGMERSPDTDRQIREDIETAPSEMMEYTCSGPDCDFSVSGSTQDEIIEHAHMHQEIAHGMKSSPEMDRGIRENIRPLSSTGMRGSWRDTGTKGMRSESIGSDRTRSGGMGSEGTGSGQGNDVEPIKPGDSRVARRKGSLLDTCYPTSSGLRSQKKE